MYRLLILLIMSTVLIGCSGRGNFERIELMPEENWNRFRKIWADYEAGDSKGSYDLVLIVRYKARFEQQNLDVMGTIHTPSGEMRFKEYKIALRDVNLEISGTKIAGEGEDAIYETRYVFRPAFRFADTGRYRFEIENLSPRYDNPGIVAVGVGVVYAGR